MATDLLLGVGESLCGKAWSLQPSDPRLELALVQRLGVPEVIGRILAARGIGLDEAELFLSPTLKALLPDPDSFRDMTVAVERLVRAICGEERIAIFGDYDVDGATASALLQRFLSAVGQPARIYIPDRIEEGYGPNEAALRTLREEGARLVVTVDCGVTAAEALEAASEAGLDVIVVDHHMPEARLPRVLAVINPNRLDEDTPHRQLAAVGVAFLLVVAVNRALRASGWYAARREPDLMQWLDLVALGTVCDVVPLTGLNRALVAQGLKVMARRSNPGMAALADVAALKGRPDAYHLGYLLGPRVNAGGRVGQADLGARLLCSEDGAEVAALSRRLDDFNRERQEIEAAVLQLAILQVESQAEAPVVPPVIVAAGENWHPGVLGIVAGRLKERYNRPAIAIGLAGDIGKGSGRSVPGINLGAAVIAARQAGLLITGGGHPMAAGLSVARGLLPELRAFLAERIQGGEPEGTERTSPKLRLDGLLSVAGATAQLVDLLERLGPFGAGNSQPRFAFPSLLVRRAEVVGGGGHVRCEFTELAGGRRLKGIAFRAADGALGRGLLAAAGMAVHIAGTLRRDDWRGGSEVQLTIEDAALAGAP